MRRIQPLLAAMLFASLPGAQVKNASPVTFLAAVNDSRGRAIGDLRQDDFELREDGKDLKIASFATFRNIPSSVGILLDVSGSMRPKLAKATNAVEDFVNGLHRDDETFLMPFANRSTVASDYSDGRSELIHVLRRLQAEGETALYDAIADGIRKLQQGHNRQRKVLVLFSDGADSISGTKYEQVMRLLRESDVILYGIGIPAGFGSVFYAPGSNFAGQVVIQGPRGPAPVPFPIPGTGIPLPIPGRPLPLPAPKSPDDTGDTVNMSLLDAFAQVTGGRSWRVEDPQRRIGEPLDRIVTQMLSELRNQYLIGFVPEHPLKDGQWHSVLIRTKESGTNVRTRKEYLGK